MLIAERTAESVGEEIAELAAWLERSLSRWLALVAEFDALGGARHQGFRGTAEWLAWRCGIRVRTARDHVRVARGLTRMPLLRAAFADGTLSYSKVRALTRAQYEGDEAALIAVARSCTAAQLEAHLRALPSSPSADPDVERHVYESRYLDYEWDADGGMEVRAYLPAVDAAVFAEAVETGAEALHPVPGSAKAHAAPVPDDWHAGSEPSWRPPLGARRADALAEIMAGGAPRVQIVLHASDTAFAYIEGGPAISPATFGRLACDALFGTAEGAGSRDLGRSRRLPNAAQRNALLRRDRTCRFPGCERRHGLQPHHADHWAAGGRTDMDNQAMFCAFHHRLFHHEGFSVRQTGPVVTVHAPDGTVIPQCPRKESNLQPSD